MRRAIPALVVAGAIAMFARVGVPANQSSPYMPVITAEKTGCTPEQRREALRAMQREVLATAPSDIGSFAKALAPGGPLAGWNLSHGYVVLSTAGAVATDNLKAVAPMPPLLLYEPSDGSEPDDWLDFDGPDDPYRLVGWAYIGLWSPGSRPPTRRCIAEDEWVVHEAGWHLRDGGMQLTPGAAAEPPRPPGLDVHMWHPRVWDLHVWRGDNDVPAVTFANPGAREGGVKLPDGSFFYLVDGKKHVVATGTM